MQPKDKKQDDRPIAYPHSTEADKQLQNQPEFVDQEPNTYNKEISDIQGQEANEQEASPDSSSSGV